jgi:uncharacterized protein YraI/LysM repeat protein
MQTLKHLRRMLFAALAAVLLLTALPAMAQPSATAVINTAFLNVRSGPGLEYGAIATLPKGYGVNLVGRNAAYNWVFISDNAGLQGWVNVNYISTGYPISQLPINNVIPPSAPAVPVVTITGILSADIHDRPGDDATIVAYAPIDSTFQLVGRSFNSQWAQIRLNNGALGWVRTAYVSSTVPVRSVNPTDGSVATPYTTTNLGSSSPTTGRTHVIKFGETLGGIAATYKVDLQTLAAVNSIYNVNWIYAGQTLIIPQ